MQQLSPRPTHPPSRRLSPRLKQRPRQPSTLRPKLPLRLRPPPRLKQHIETKQTIICFEPGTNTLTAAYGAALEQLGLPAEVTALYSNGTTAQLAVTWTYVSDGLGGTAYIPEHENPLEAVYTFQAALADGSACPVALPTATVTYAMPMLMANGEVESGNELDFPYTGDFVRSSESYSVWMSWERVPGESLTVTLKSGSCADLKQISAYAEEKLTLIVQPNALLTIKSGIDCPYTVINSGEVYVESGATCTINNANGQNVYVETGGEATLTGETAGGAVTVAGVLHAEGITFMGNPTGHDGAKLYLKNAVLKSGLVISPGCDVYGDITVDNLSGEVNKGNTYFSGTMREGIIIVKGWLGLKGSPSCVIELQGAGDISYPDPALDSNADLEIRVSQAVLDRVVKEQSKVILQGIRDGVFYHMEEIELSSDANSEFQSNSGTGGQAFNVEGFGFVGSAEEFAKIPAGQEAPIVVNVNLEGEFAHFYSFYENDDPTRAQSILYLPVNKLPLNALSFAFEGFTTATMPLEMSILRRCR